MSRNTLFELDERLALCASFVRQDSKLADVGTDHAFLPVRLAAEGKIISAVASDVRTGPLKNAESNIRLYGVEDKVRAVLSDGLDNISPDLADDIVIAGMGGELIAKIIKRTQWLYDGSKRLILQPMTRMESLRLFLYQDGFCIEKEKACVSGRKHYSVMLCRYDGVIRECSKKIQYIGSLGDDDSEEADGYINMIKTKLKRKIDGLEKSGRLDEAAYFRSVIEEIEGKSEAKK